LPKRGFSIILTALIILQIINNQIERNAPKNAMQLERGKVHAKPKGNP
jgi:hypothetical protein